MTRGGASDRAINAEARCLATCLMRSSACDTLSRSCARRVLCWLAFPSASALGSTDPAAGCPALFVLRPGDVLVAVNHLGKGHKWRLIDDQPWRRAYVVFKPGTKDSFVAKKGKPGAH
jgi:hypothetical protein